MQAKNDYDFMEVKGHQRSNISCAMATIFGQKN